MLREPPRAEAWRDHIHAKRGQEEARRAAHTTRKEGQNGKRAPPQDVRQVADPRLGAESIEGRPGDLLLPSEEPAERLRVLVCKWYCLDTYRYCRTNTHRLIKPVRPVDTVFW